MESHLALVRLLADGEYHSGELIAAHMGVSRAAVWKAMGRVREHYGLSIESARGRGYRLSSPLELLDAGEILSDLSRRGQAPIGCLEIHDQIGSTNARLMEQARAGAPSGSVCLAERQTAGRGRRGRTWVSPFGVNLYLSVLWRSPQAPAAWSGASLAAGASVASVLRDVGVRGLMLKWPNDLLWHRRKLGGLLLEVAGEAQGPSYLVVGLGLNLRMDSDQGEGIEQPWTDLDTAMAGLKPGRNALGARLIGALLQGLDQYDHTGLAPFLDTWASFDGLRGEPVSLQLGERVINGIHAGIDPDGALRLETDEGIRSFHAGEVTLRPTWETGD